MCVVFSMREDYGFNYGETLRIRRELYTILGRYAALILMEIFGMSIS